jgi:putative ATP-dependent endonuclease of OLD family
VLRHKKDGHVVMNVGSKEDNQGTVRAFPEAFLASSVIVCEGAREVGLLRGVDQFRASEGKISMAAIGVSLVDANGCDNLYRRANAFRRLGYRTTVLRDDDKQPSKMIESIFVKMHGPIFKWRPGRALEDELLNSLPASAVVKLLEYAVELHGETLVEEHIKSVSSGKVALAACKAKLTPDIRAHLANACATKSTPWFKSVSAMEHCGREIVGPALEASEESFRNIVESVFGWIENGRS